MANEQSTTGEVEKKAGGIGGYVTRAVKRVLRTAMQGARQRWEALRGQVGGGRRRQQDDTTAAPRPT